MSKVEPLDVDQVSFEPDVNTRRKSGVHRPKFAPLFKSNPSSISKPKRVHLFVNPFSGKKRGGKVGEIVHKQLEEAGIEVNVKISSYSGELIDLAAGIDAKPGDVFAVVGGDGSLSEVLTGRLSAHGPCDEIFAAIPAGTGNSMAHDLKLDSAKAVVAIIGGKRQALDIAKVQIVKGLPGCEGGPQDSLIRYSHNLVTWGLGVDSTIQAEKMRWMGPARYDVGILSAIAANRRRTATLTLDGKSVTGDFTLFLVQNSQTGGAQLPLAPGASMDDGLMDIGILQKMSRRELIKVFGMLKKEGRHVFHPRVDYHRFSSLSIETPSPSGVNVDGENLGSTPLSMEVMSGAVQMIVP
jgi:diacylglycerol kinase (ATP)